MTSPCTRSVPVTVRDLALSRYGGIARGVPETWHGFRFASRLSRMKHSPSLSGFPSRPELLLARARRAQQRGERRQALVALREATLLAETDARLWALYGSACFKANRVDEAERAFGQALYLRQREHDSRRVQALRSVIMRLGLVRAA